MADNNVIRAVPPNTGAEEMVIGADQPDFTEMVVGKYMAYRGAQLGVLSDPVPMMLYRFAPSTAQRRAIAAGEDLFLAVMTFGRPPLPLELTIGPGTYQETKHIATPDADSR